MIYFDVTKCGDARHRSGLTRVSRRLQEELGAVVVPVVWDGGLRTFSDRSEITPKTTDWFLTGELFSEGERPGFSDFIRAQSCRLAAIFHDAIPLKLPHITWSQSVQRHPEYMKMLAAFDHVWSVSAASQSDLLGFWRWQGAEVRAQTNTLMLGADFARVPRGQEKPDLKTPLLCVGILEPRKNQWFLLDVCEALWGEGVKFDLHLVGRVNDQFGRPLATRIKRLKKKWPGLRYHEAVDDETLLSLYRQVRASVFPTIAEGCGLPLLESLWMGVPCVCSDLPVLLENAAAGGCELVPPNNLQAWKDALRRVIDDEVWRRRLQSEVIARALPTWAQTAEQLRQILI